MKKPLLLGLMFFLLMPKNSAPNSPTELFSTIRLDNNYTALAVGGATLITTGYLLLKGINRVHTVTQLNKQINTLKDAIELLSIEGLLKCSFSRMNFQEIMEKECHVLNTSRSFQLVPEDTPHRTELLNIISACARDCSANIVKPVKNLTAQEKTFLQTILSSIKYNELTQEWELTETFEWYLKQHSEAFTKLVRIKMDQDKIQLELERDRLSCTLLYSCFSYFKR